MIGSATRFTPRPRPARLVLTILTTTLLISCAQLTAQSLDPEVCHRITLEEEIMWPAAAVWLDDEIALVDATQGSLRAVRVDGAHRGAVRALSEIREGIDRSRSPLEVEQLQWSVPVLIQQLPNGGMFIEEELQVERQDGKNEVLERAYRLDATRQVERIDPIDRLPLTSTPSAYSRLSTYDTIAFGDGYLAFADFRSEETKNYHRGFTYFDRDEQLTLEPHFTPYGDAIQWYLLLSPLSATLDDDAFFLLLEDEKTHVSVSLGQADFDRDQIISLRALPAPYDRLPTFEDTPREADVDREIAGLRKLEESIAITGLFGWNEALYLPAKQAATDDGPITWELLQLDPADGSLINKIPLPETRARHLTVIPGDTFWAFIERDRAFAYGPRYKTYVRARSVMLLPARWMTGDSELTRPVHCR
ncbi:MAG: hypothetical protein AAGD38_02095 [Acidobacteriota bacterium]